MIKPCLLLVKPRKMRCRQTRPKTSFCHFSTALITSSVEKSVCWQRGGVWVWQGLPCDSRRWGSGACWPVADGPKKGCNKPRQMGQSCKRQHCWCVCVGGGLPQWAPTAPSAAANGAGGPRGHLLVACAEHGQLVMCVGDLPVQPATCTQHKLPSNLHGAELQWWCSRLLHRGAAAFCTGHKGGKQREGPQRVWLAAGVAAAARAARAAKRGAAGHLAGGKKGRRANATGNGNAPLPPPPPASATAKRQRQCCRRRRRPRHPGFGFLAAAPRGRARGAAWGTRCPLSLPPAPVPWCTRQAFLGPPCPPGRPGGPGGIAGVVAPAPPTPTAPRPPPPAPRPPPPPPMQCCPSGGSCRQPPPPPPPLGRAAPHRPWGHCRQRRKKAPAGRGGTVACTPGVCPAPHASHRRGVGGQWGSAGAHAPWHARRAGKACCCMAAGAGAVPCGSAWAASTKQGLGRGAGCPPHQHRMGSCLQFDPVDGQHKVSGRLGWACHQ